jgi:hypothetical protein
MAHRQIATLADQKLEGTRHLGQHLAGAERLRPRGGKFDGERNAFQPATQRGDGAGIARGQLKVGANGPRAIKKQAHHRVLN